MLFCGNRPGGPRWSGAHRCAAASTCWFGQGCPRGGVGHGACRGAPDGIGALFDVGALRCCVGATGEGRRPSQPAPHPRPGLFGVAIADDRVFADVETFAVAEVAVDVSVEHHLLHGMHVALAQALLWRCSRRCPVAQQSRSRCRPTRPNRCRLGRSSPFATECRRRGRRRANGLVEGLAAIVTAAIAGFVRATPKGRQFGDRRLPPFGSGLARPSRLPAFPVRRAG